MATEHTRFFAIQPWVAALLQEKNLENARYLPLGVPLRCQQPSLQRAEVPDIPVAFIGTSARRVELFSKLTDFGLQLWGPAGTRPMKNSRPALKKEDVGFLERRARYLPPRITGR